MSADDLVGLVAQLGAPFGLERSVKIIPGALLDDRCLISVHRSALGKAPAGRLAEMAYALGIPREFAGRLPLALSGADIVHFGHESGPGFELRKIYFEYAAQARRAMASLNDKPVLVHLAFKWPLHGNAAPTVAHYHWVPCRARHHVEEKFRELLPARDAPRALQCAMGLLSRVAPLADQGRVLVMQVEESGNPRRSCDLNVYDAGLRVGQLLGLIEATTREFAVPQSRSFTVLEGARDATLGHLSAGLSRDGQEFVTVYYGVEAH